MELLIIPSCEGHYPRVYLSTDSPYDLSAKCMICDSKVSAYTIEGLNNSEIDQLINHDSSILTSRFDTTLYDTNPPINEGVL